MLQGFEAVTMYANHALDHVILLQAVRLATPTAWHHRAMAAAGDNCLTRGYGDTAPFSTDPPLPGNLTFPASTRRTPVTGVAPSMTAIPFARNAEARTWK